MASYRINFTKATLETLPPAAKGYDFYYDTNKAASRGFGLWVTCSGAKTFAVYRKVGGRPERIKIGAFPDLSIKNARKKAEGLNAAIADGKNPNEIKRGSRDQITLGELFNLYTERHSKLKTKRWKDGIAIFDNHFSSWRNRKLSNLRKADIQHWHSDIGSNNGPYIANRCLQLIRAIINWGIQEAALIGTDQLENGANPATGISLFPEKKRDRFLQGDEIPRFFRALDEEPSADMRDLFLLALLTGARKMNVAAMRWEDVSIDRAEWRIPDTKNNEPHTIPIVPAALEIIKARLSQRKGNFVFPSNSVTGYIVSPKKAWRRILDRGELFGLIEIIGAAENWNQDYYKTAYSAARTSPAKALKSYREKATELELDANAAKLHDLRIHDLRRSLGSWQAATGASLAIIGKSLGHKSVSATQVYARLNLDPVRRSMEAAVSALIAKSDR